MMFVPFYEKEIAGKGTGVFASEFIPEGSLIWKMTEQKRYTKAELKRLPKNKQVAAYKDDKGNYIVAAKKGESWNHSCDSNTWWTADDELSAKRDIQKGEEITYDYATTDIDRNKGTEVAFSWKCKCGSENCRKVLHWNDILKPEIYRQHQGHLPSWVEKFVSETQATNHRE